MSVLTITAKGQVTLRKEFLRHLDVKPGDKIEVAILPGGETGTFRRKTGAWRPH